MSDITLYRPRDSDHTWIAPRSYIVRQAGRSFTECETCGTIKMSPAIQEPFYKERNSFSWSPEVPRCIPYTPDAE